MNSTQTTSATRGSGWPELVCPDDGQPLTVVNGALTCPQGHRWRVERGIPRMVPGTETYADAFGLQWQEFRKTQLDSFTGIPISLERARRCLGDELWAILHGPNRTNVLEVGCGAGRFTEVLLSTGAHVTSVDLSIAVDANQANCPQDDRHRVLQADVRRLPFKPRQYDVAFCLGVIQHTPSPEETIAQLYEQIKPGGWLVIDHYTYTLGYFTKPTALVRRAMRQLSPERGLKWSERIVNVFFPLHHLVRRNKLALLVVGRFTPIACYYQKLPLNDQLQREWSLLDTHDALTDWYKHFRTKGQIARTLQALGAVDIHTEYGNGVEARARRPRETTAGLGSI